MGGYAGGMGGEKEVEDYKLGEGGWILRTL